MEVYQGKEIQRSIPLEAVVKKMNLVHLNPEISYEGIEIHETDVSRPSLQLTGFFEYFAHQRMQIIGFVEYNFLLNQERNYKIEKYRMLMEYPIPCFIFCRDTKPDEDFLEIANAHRIPLFATDQMTSPFCAEMIRWLNVQLAPKLTLHGVLVDVYGEGVLIMGESGIGKSEAALELLRRGHRLVSDDSVEIHKVSGETLVGTAPDVTRYFIELRGIGIVDVKTMFGVECVKETQSISLVIKLEEWDEKKAYDRLGLDEEYTEILGIRVASHHIPIRPGRNLAIIVETAAVNFRQKKMGYNAAKALYARVTESMERKEAERHAHKA